MGKTPKPVVEVRPEPTYAQVLLQVAVRGGDDPDVDLARLRRAEPLDLAVLEDAQELRLEGGVELADLVEEERPAVGELEPARLRLGRAGEGALLVAEELALDERGGQGGAVHRDEGPVAPRAVRVKAAGEQLLAGAGLAEEEDRRVGVGHLTDSLQRLAEGGAPPDDLAEVPSLAELGLSDRRSRSRGAHGDARSPPGRPGGRPRRPGGQGRPR